uniref:Hypothetical chloroplast RF66 n=1 Tax=Chlorokybus atmophyticus TaxID=3144 RepID=A2CI55_CHLAT|nr:hypothetical chloroplast RF66 [Chlorokybus atmophyticus]ABM87975.1 hypothetical chloroplast RF66 [Chlorokybus atmophyticus]WKT05641.1 hypothetical chloroplast RF66 [Chlorokybus atmophyticus]
MKQQILPLNMRSQKAITMINIEFGPSTILGVALVFGGVILYMTRTIRPEVARDYDIFFSSVGLLSGGILIFQGWRLDPILLFGQMLSSGTAIFFVLESIRLRYLNNKQSGQQKERHYVPIGNKRFFVDQTRMPIKLREMSNTSYAANQSPKNSIPLDATVDTLFHVVEPFITKKVSHAADYTKPIQYNEYDAEEPGLQKEEPF